jgi:hypothetical protein
MEHRLSQKVSQKLADEWELTRGAVAVTNAAFGLQA